MKPRHYSSQAIVLAKKNYSESDRIITLFSKDYGKLTLLAKGVRKPKSRKRGSLEVFNYIKFAASEAHGFDIITEVETIEAFESVRSNLRKLSVAYFFMEVIARLIREDEKHGELFTFVVRNLRKLEVSTQLKDLRHKFIIDALTLLGFWPKGKELADPDSVLEEIVERDMHTKRVGIKLLG